MPESIDCYMDENEKGLIIRSLKLTLAILEADWIKADMVYNKERMAEIEAQQVEYEQLLGQFQ